MVHTHMCKYTCKIKIFKEQKQDEKNAVVRAFTARALPSVCQPHGPHRLTLNVFSPLVGETLLQYRVYGEWEEASVGQVLPVQV